MSYIELTSENFNEEVIQEKIYLYSLISGHPGAAPVRCLDPLSKSSLTSLTAR